MDANDVALFLKENPKFFEDYADVIAEIFVPHPHGGHAIPIAERQIVARGWLWEHYVTPTLRVGTYRVGAPRP